MMSAVLHFHMQKEHERLDIGMLDILSWRSCLTMTLQFFSKNFDLQKPGGLLKTLTSVLLKNILKTVFERRHTHFKLIA